jgi:hypothetical protein
MSDDDRFIALRHRATKKLSNGETIDLFVGGFRVLTSGKFFRLMGFKNYFGILTTDCFHCAAYEWLG